MSSTMNLIRKPKSRPVNKSKSPALMKCPQKGAIVKKSFIVSPRKPNSAKRKVAKVVFRRTKRIADIYLEGIEFNRLNPHSVVLVRGRGPRDLPGVRYHAVRGKGDFPPLMNRRNGRSKYGAKRPKKPETKNNAGEKVLLFKDEKEAKYRFLVSPFRRLKRLNIRY